jgi:hypothetical protein
MRARSDQHPLSHFAHHRVEAVDEGHGADDGSLICFARQPRRIPEVGRQGLLADNVHPGTDRGQRKPIVEEVRRAHVQDVYAGIEQIVDTREGPLGAEGIAGATRTLERRRGDADERAAR